MSARLLDGKKIAETMRAEIAERSARFTTETGIRPHLAAVLVGSDSASEVYVKSKRLACDKAGMTSSLETLPENATQKHLLSVIDSLNANRQVHGILVQLPMPKGIDESAVLRRVDPLKDVDAFHPYNVGLIAEGQPRFLPCTPFGIQQMLTRSDIEISGAHVVIVGRSSLVGRPLAIMLSQKGRGADATVTLCHSRTRNLIDHVRQADIVVAAIGKAQFITRDMVKPGAVVVDVGINRLADGKLVGDVDFAGVSEVASAITPVPGGVGKMTVTMLLENTLKAARLAVEQS